MEKSTEPIINHISDFLDYCEVEKGLADRTQKNYYHYLKKFVDWLKKGQMEAFLPHELTPKHIWSYRLYLSRFQNKKGGSLKRITQNYYLIALRAFLRYFVAKDIECLPPDKIALPKDAKSEKVVKFLTLEHVEKLLLAPNTKTEAGLRDRAILEVLFSTGLRIAELVALNRDQFADISGKKDLELGIIGKGSYPRTIYFSERALLWLKKYLVSREDKEKALFIHYKAKKDVEGRLTARSIQRIVKKYAILAGVPLFTTPHTLRHCLYPSTRIILSDAIISARDLFFHKASKAKTINWENLQLTDQEIEEKSYHITPLYSLWADGYNLVCSPEHRLFVVGSKGIEEKKTKDLEIGNYLMGIKKIEIETKSNSFVALRFARLLGYILGDGTINKKRRAILLDDKNQNILKFYQNLVRELFGLNPSLIKSKNKNSWQLKIHNAELVEFALDIGFGHRANLRRAPKQILSAPLEELAEFIAGLYDAEGNTGNIRLFSSSLDLLKDIQMGLLRFGIDSHINWRQRNVTLPQKRIFSHKFYTLHIFHLPDQLEFIKNIKTLKKRFLRVEPEFEGEKLPVGKLLKTIKQDTVKKKIVWIEELRKNHSINYLGRYFDNFVPLRKTVKKIITQLDASKYHSHYLETLKKIAYADNIKWLRLRRKTRLPWGRYSTYDFGINRETGNIITDGIVSHNSFATDLLNQGVDLRTIQEFLGHRSITSTQIYTHVTNKRLRDIHRQFHSGKKLKE